MQRILATALVAGSIAGLFVFALHIARLTPLILAAEAYERAEPHAEVDAEHGSWAPSEGLERTAYTAVADMIVGIGFALLLVGGFTLRGKPIDLRAGLAWGIAGYAVFTLAPAFGLPPELPGSHAAGLLARQEWWAGTVVASALGLALMAFSTSLMGRAVGIGLIMLPHLIGAPPPPEIGGALPAELAAEFTAASMAITAAFWLVLGAVSGGIYARLGRSVEA
jgi:cobalt transporter subunit CbtA